MERALVERARGVGPSGTDIRNRAAFDAFVRSRVDAVYRTSLAILGDTADAADATQEAFVSAWRQVGSLRDPARFDAWFGRIHINACRAQLRRRKRTLVREVELPDTDFGAEPAAPGRPFDDSLADADVFDRAFARLSVDDRAVLVLHHLQERSVASMAAALGKPEGTIKARLFRARAALESALAKESR